MKRVIKKRTLAPASKPVTRKKVVFKPRKQNVLEKTFTTREDRSTSSSKGIFKEGMISEFVPAKSDTGSHNEVFIGPLDFEGEDGYHVDVSIHYDVGIAQDMYICPLRYQGSRCPECEQQQKMFAVRRNKGISGSLSDDPNDTMIKSLYPKDAAVYLVLDMQNMEEGWKAWRAGKAKIHSEIAARTHNKRTMEYIDLCNMEDGRIVSFTCSHKKGQFPVYSNFNLDELEEPIPDHLQDQLIEIIEQGMEAMPKVKGSAVKQFLHIPTYEEMDEARKTSIDAKDTASTDISDGGDEDEVLSVEDVRNELQDLSRLQMKRWAKDHGIEVDIKGMSGEEIIEGIIEAMESDDEPEEEKPECFGEAEDYQECVECNWLERGCADETEARRS